MAFGVVAARRPDVARRAAPLAASACAVAGAAFLATHNPTGSGVRYPACMFHQTTGLWCPGCGLTRGCYELLHGRVGAALSYNVFAPVAVLLVVTATWAWIRWAWRRPLHVSSALQQRLLIGLPVVLVVYGVLRNMPMHPLRALAP